MKKSIVLILLSGLIFLSGCSLLGGKKSTNAEATSKSFEKEEPADEQSSSDMQQAEEKSAEPVKVKDRLDITLYYQDKDGYVIPATRKVEKQEGIAKAALNALVDNALNREEIEYYGLYPVFPQGTQILGMTIKEGIAWVDFNSKLLNYKSNVEERNIITSIIYTLTEFKTISGVRILINGYTVGKLEYGTEISDVLDRYNIMINTSEVNVGEAAGKLDAYFFKRVNEEHIFTLPVSFKSMNMEDSDKPEMIVELLRDGAKEEKYFTQIPGETALTNSSLEEKRVVLDFNSGLTSYGGGNTREDGIIKQILYSMKQIKGVEKVKILINGGSKGLPEGTDISKELVVPNEINNVIDN